MKTNKPKKNQTNTAMIYQGGQPGGQQYTVTEVYRGQMQSGDEDKIRSGLIEGQFFVPQVAGITPAREGLQRVAHKFLRLETTTERNTDPRKIVEVVKAMAAMKEDLPKFQDATKARPVFRTR